MARRQPDPTRSLAADIRYLGSGVSNVLGLRRGDIAKLTAAGLPVLSTPADLAARWGFPSLACAWLAYHNEAATQVHYVQFQVPKKSGGLPTLRPPTASSPPPSAGS